jgi:hypothetical protein
LKLSIQIWVNAGGHHHWMMAAHRCHDLRDLFRRFPWAPNHLWEASSQAAMVIDPGKFLDGFKIKMLELI